MHQSGQRSVAVFTWEGDTPSPDATCDPEVATAMLSQGPATAILNALRVRGYASNDSVPYDGESGWHFEIRIESEKFDLFTLWTGMPVDNYFSVQLSLNRGMFAALFRKPVFDHRLEPICRALDEAFAMIPFIKAIWWLTDEQFAEYYCRGAPLPAVTRPTIAQ